MLDLAKLENKLDKQLKIETKESLEYYLNTKRMKFYIIRREDGKYFTKKTNYSKFSDNIYRSRVFTLERTAKAVATQLKNGTQFNQKYNVKILCYETNLYREIC